MMDASSSLTTTEKLGLTIGNRIMSMTNNKKTELDAQKVYAHGVNKDTHFNTPQGPRPYPKVNYDKMWNVEGYYNDNDGFDIRDRD